MISPTFGNYGDVHNDLVAEMIRNQLDTVQVDFRLTHCDLKRIAKYVEQSIFTPNICTLWQGYVTDRKKSNKGSYVNFYFRRKKIALHRLLYINFMGPLQENEYVRFRCKNKGHCCNINCLEKNRYTLYASGPDSKIIIPLIPFSDKNLNILFI